MDEFDAALAASEGVLLFGAWFRTVGSSSVRWSSGMHCLLGLHSSVTPSHDLLLAALHPEDRRVAFQHAPAEQGAAARRQLRLKHATGTYRFVKSYLRHLETPGAPSRQLGLLFEASTHRDEIARHVLSQFGQLQHRPLDGGALEELDWEKPLTGDLVRAARGLLDWTLQDLAKASGLSFSTARRAEFPMDRSIAQQTQFTIRRAFEGEGVRFVEVGGKVGVVIARQDAELPAPAKPD